MESEIDQSLQGPDQIEIRWRYCDPGGYLHPSLSRQKWLNPRDDFREAGCAIFEGPLAIVGAPDAVETDGDSKLMPLEKIAVFRCEQCSICRDRKPNVNARGSRQSSGVFGRGSQGPLDSPAARRREKRG